MTNTTRQLGMATLTCLKKRRGRIWTLRMRMAWHRRYGPRTTATWTRCGWSSGEGKTARHCLHLQLRELGLFVVLQTCNPYVCMYASCETASHRNRHWSQSYHHTPMMVSRRMILHSWWFYWVNCVWSMQFSVLQSTSLNLYSWCLWLCNIS